MTDQTMTRIDRFEELRLGLKAVRAMLNQPVQYTEATKDAEQLARRVQILRGDCAGARRLIDLLLKEPTE
jgi:hypothetical protein